MVHEGYGGDGRQDDDRPEAEDGDFVRRQPQVIDESAQAAADPAAAAPIEDDHSTAEPSGEVVGDSTEVAPKSRFKSYAVTVGVWAGVIAGVIAYWQVPWFTDGFNWVAGVAFAAIVWLMLNGFAVPILSGMVTYLIDAIAGVRLNTWGYNMGRVPWKPQAKIGNIGFGFITDRPDGEGKFESFVNQAFAALAIGVGYMFVKLTWFTEAPANGDQATLWDILSDLQSHGELLQTSAGVFIGILAAPWVGRFIRKIIPALVINDVMHFERWPILRSVIGGIATVLRKLNQWGHLDHVQSEEQMARNRKAMSVSRATIYPVAFAINTVVGIFRFFFSAGHPIIFSWITLRGLVWTYLLLVAPWMVETWAPFVLTAINYSLYVPIMLLAVTVLWSIYRSIGWLVALVLPVWAARSLGAVVTSILAIFVFKLADEFDYYTHLAYQHESLAIVPVTADTQPVMVNARLNALGVIAAGVDAQLEGGVETSSPPVIVSTAEGERWTAIVDELLEKKRWFEPARLMYSLPASKTGVSFSKADGQLLDVCFDASPQGRAGRNVMTAAYRRLPMSKLVNYRPDEVRPMFDDSGRPVQVVSIVKYVGAPLRRMQLGGVVIIRECDQEQQRWLQNLWVGDMFPAFAKTVDEVMPALLHRELFGLGEYVSAEEIASGKYPFLRGNNLVAEDVARRMAESFRFHVDWLAPLSTARAGDVRIFDRKDDGNTQPHIGVWADMPGRPEPTVYANLMLQPWGKSDTLAYEVWVPADGSTDEDGRPIVYMLDTEAEGMDTEFGPSWVASQVRVLLDTVDWEQFVVVEATSFKRRLGGKVRSMYLARLAGKRGDGTLAFSDDPRVFVIDRQSKQKYELTNLDASDEERDAEILAAFGEKWGVAMPTPAPVENGG